MDQGVLDIILEKKPSHRVRKWGFDGDFLLASSFDKSNLCILNRTSAQIFSLVDGKRTINEIISAFFLDYPDIEKKVIVEDVIRNLRDLESKYLIYIDG